MPESDSGEYWSDGVCAPLPMAVVVSVSGKDAQSIVNNLSTNDVRSLTVGTAVETFITDVRGWVVAFVNVVCLDKEVLLVGQLSDPAILVRHIDRYIVREDAVVRDRSAEVATFVIDGKKSAVLFPASNELDKSARTSQLIEISRGDLVAQVYHAPITSAISKIAIVPSIRAEEFQGWMRDLGLRITNAAAEFEHQRISAFWPVAGREIVEKTLPQELDRDSRAISFTKGCYLGQETVARLDARGQLQKKLCLLSITGSPDVGAQLTCEGKPAGAITSLSTDAARQRSLAQAYVRRGFFEPGTQLEIGTNLAIVLDPISQIKSA